MTWYPYGCPVLTEILIEAMASNDIIFIGDIDWDVKRELPVHHVVRLLAKHHRVFYVDNFGGIRGLMLADIPRILRKARNILSRQLAAPAPSAGDPASIAVFQPFILPTPRLSRMVGRLNVWLLRRALKRLVVRYDIHDPIIWTRVPSETAWKSIAGIPRSALVYQSVDRFVSSPMVPEYARPRLEQYERTFSESADLIFASAHGLYEEKRQINPNTHFFPNGVDPTLFADVAMQARPLSHVPRPIVGFAGSLGPWVDYELLRRTAVMTPEWSYVLVGPVNPGIELRPLNALPNVHFTGAVPHAELPSYLVSFDCGLIPYVIDQFTQFTFPSKLAEYLAAGLPVVSTPLPELSPYDDVVAIVDDAESMVRAIGSCVDAQAQELREKRINVAQSLSWDTIVSRMEQTLDTFLNTGAKVKPLS